MTVIKSTANGIRTGAGFSVCKNNEILFEQSFSLGSYSSINQCELFAINQAAVWIDTVAPVNMKIHIFSDSQSTLQKLESGRICSKLALESIELLNKLSKSNHIELIKVQAHKGIKGNERADFLAKKGADKSPIGPELMLGFTINNIINDLKNKLLDKQYDSISKSNIVDRHKTPLTNYLSKYGHNLLLDNKNKLKIFTHMFSGQNHLANNHSKRDVTVVPYCRHCPSIKETAEHFLTACPAYSLPRIQTFGYPIITNMVTLYKIFKPSDIVKFVNATGRLTDKYVCYYID